MEKIKVKQLKEKKWTLYLYYNGVLIKKLKVDKDEEPAKKSYVINIQIIYCSEDLSFIFYLINK